MLGLLSFIGVGEPLVTTISYMAEMYLTGADGQYVIDAPSDDGPDIGDIALNDSLLSAITP